MVKATEESIGDSIDFIIESWRETQLIALNQVEYPSIENDALFFKAVGWINFATDTASALFPKSEVANYIDAIKNRYAIPLWILDTAASEFKKAYSKHVNHSNLLLKTQYDDIKSDYENKIKKIARNFKNESFGREIARQLGRYLGNRDFKDSKALDVFLREMILHAQLIVTDSSVIKARTKAGFGNLLKKIHTIWKASYHGPRGGPYLYYRYNRNYEWEHPGKVDQDWILANAWAMSVEYVKHRKRDRVLVESFVNPYSTNNRLAHTYKGAAIDLAGAERNMRLGEEYTVTYTNKEGNRIRAHRDVHGKVKSASAMESPRLDR